MAYSKVIFNGTTIMDVTQDTVAAENLLSGETATRNDGVRITGEYEGGGVQTTLVSGIYATDILYYTNENMEARSGYEIIDLNLPVGTLIFVYNTGPTASDPVGVTKLKEYGTPMKGQYILYMVGETHDGGSND